MRVQLRRGAHFSLDAMLVSEKLDEIWLFPVRGEHREVVTELSHRERLPLGEGA